MQALPSAAMRLGRRDRATPRPRYDVVTIVLHWLLGVALIAQIAFGWLLNEIERGTPERSLYVNLHKSSGIVLGIVVLLRLGWRLRHRPPPWPSSMPAWQQRAARVGHVALYVCMVLMPLSGYVASNFSRHGVKFFGLPLAPWGPDLPAVYDVLGGVHQVTAWVFSALVLGHVLVAIKHALDRDGVFSRVWPWPAARRPPA